MSLIYFGPPFSGPAFSVNPCQERGQSPFTTSGHETERAYSFNRGARTRPTSVST